MIMEAVNYWEVKDVYDFIDNFISVSNIKALKSVIEAYYKESSYKEEKEFLSQVRKILEESPEKIGERIRQAESEFEVYLSDTIDSDGDFINDVLEEDNRRFFVVYHYYDDMFSIYEF